MSKQFQIQFEPMNLGSHQLEFMIDQELFKKWENGEVLSADVIIDIELNKSANMMDLRFTYEGQLEVPCDRCNEGLYIPLRETGKLIVKYGQVEHEEIDDFLILDDKEHVLDLEAYFYESLSLLIPQRKVHDEADCDPAVLSILKDSVEENNNKIDPRWEGLKEI